MNKEFRIASILGALAIILGALGAHALRDILTPRELESFKTGVMYHMFHALFMLIITFSKYANNLKPSYYLALTGIILFSGSIYLLCLDQYLGINLSFLGPVTPIGGIAFIAAWLALLQLKPSTN
ncbi:MAG: DUF423 domain-containing protein [Schleiferiaceae bacterium]|jgi:uncharacterized membrane protein YgdD (TMEM256/DUF423 family)|nr:DUF423 domain-containing protein [Schleiferiaceae bacterium]